MLIASAPLTALVPVQMITAPVGMQLYDLLVAAGELAPAGGGGGTVPAGPRANLSLDEDATESE